MPLSRLLTNRVSGPKYSASDVVLAQHEHDVFGTSLRKCAKAYGVSKSTLHRASRAKGRHEPKLPGGQYLGGNDWRLQLFCEIRNESLDGAPPKKSFVMARAAELYKSKFPDARPWTPSNKWYAGFVKQFEADLKSGRAQPQRAARREAENPTALLSMYPLLNSIYQSRPPGYWIPPRVTWFDETDIPRVLHKQQVRSPRPSPLCTFAHVPDLPLPACMGAGCRC